MSVAPSPLRRRPTRAFLCSLAVLVATGAVACRSNGTSTPVRSTSPSAGAAPGRPAPDFELFDQFGSPHRLSDFRGKVVLLTFVSSKCTTICPLTADLLRKTQGLLGARGAGVQLVAVNTNYRFISTADVLKWSRRHDMTHRWVFLTGLFATLRSVWREYGVTGGGQHTTAVFVIDATGRIRSLVPIAMRQSLSAEARALATYVGRLGPPAA
jgi:cytochrome oxidase Cu insertion factor (SCO1/SenC/PrrC family)